MPKKRKKPGSREIEKRLFIICEGMKDKSESAYFKSFIKSCRFLGDKVEVKVIDTIQNTGKELVNTAKNSREFPHDTVWVVYDKDGYTKHPETFDAARRSNIMIGFSSISFEFWILLHFEYTSRFFRNSDQIIKYLSNENYIHYEKGAVNVFSETKAFLSKAKLNAIKIQKHQLEGNPHGTQIYKFNPYTNLNELIEEIEELQVKK